MDFVKYIINCFKVYYPKFLCKYILLFLTFLGLSNWVDEELITESKMSNLNNENKYNFKKFKHF